MKKKVFQANGESRPLCPPPLNTSLCHIKGGLATQTYEINNKNNKSLNKGKLFNLSKNHQKQ